MDSLDDERLVDDQIRQRVTDTVPPEVERRLRAQLAGLRSRLSSPESTTPRFGVGWTSPAAWWKVSATCAVALVLVALWLGLSPQVSVAEMQAALLKQPWIHLRSVLPDQSVSEAWFSTQTDVSASRARDASKFEDHRLHVYYSYDSTEQVLYRGPVVSNTSEASQMGSLAAGLAVLLQGAKLPDNPLQHLGLFGTNVNDQQVVEQKVEKIKEGAREWLDYQITVKYPRLPDPVRMTFRVDAQTKLPQLCRIEGKHNGQPATQEIQFDYPGKGPADIYEIGVPKTAKVVDRVPSGDLKRIVDSLEAGRQRMDNYRAVLVMQHGADYNWRAFPELLYRKGDRFRRDNLTSGQKIDEPQVPGADVDLRKWWFERVKPYQYYPLSMQLGQVHYTYKWKKVTAADGSSHREIDSVQQYSYNLKPGELFPADYSLRPEFVCRPPMGIGNEDQIPKIDLQPAEGPAGCILLTVEHMPRKGRMNGRPGVHRYWLDPQRDYIALQWEMVERDDTGKEVITGAIVIEETARSPQGVWYATKARQKNPAKQADGKSNDSIYHMYVDFDAELPESLFAVPGPGKVQ